MKDISSYTDNTFGPDQVLPSEGFKTSEPDGTIKIFRTECGPGADEPISVYSFLKNSAEKYQDHPALKVERNNKWITWSYADYFHDCCIIAKALIKLGLERFHGVCIMGNNSPEWVISCIGAIFAGGLSAGVYTTNSSESCYSMASNCKAQIIIVEDSTCLNKFLAVKRFLPDIKAIIQWSGNPEIPGIITWAELIAIGLHEDDQALNKRLSLTALNQCCTLIYTSGTTGPPKGVMVSQDQITWAGRQYKNTLSLLDKEERILSYLPLSHIAGNLEDIYMSINVGATVFFAGSDAMKGSLVEYLIKVRPTTLTGVPRVWEKIYEKMQEAASSAGFIKKSLGTWAKYWGLNYYEALREGRPLSIAERWKFNIANALVLNKVKQLLGLTETHMFISGAAPIDTEIMKFFFSLNMPISELYGLSETLSICTFCFIEPHQYKFGSVGKVLPTNEVKLVNRDSYRPGEGEVCVRGRNVFMGYLRMPEKTDEAIDDEGWFHTGDIGWIDSEGFLFITGRLKELIITSGGENIPPLLIEDAVKKELLCVSNAMLIGDRRRYLTILLTFKSEMDAESGTPLEDLTPLCQEWMKSVGCQFNTVKDAIREIENHPNGALAQAIEQGIERYNTNHAISNAQKIQRWTFLPHEFSLPTGELNNTLKLKRSFVLEKYAEVIENMYINDKDDEIISKL